MSNVFSCTGTVGRDAELKNTPSGQQVLTVAVANNVGFGEKQKTVWLRVTLWGSRGEKLLQYLKKGQQVFVSGEITLNEYTANDGTLKTTVELNATVIDLLGKKSDAPKPETVVTYAPPPSVSSHAPAPTKYDDDIPF